MPVDKTAGFSTVEVERLKRQPFGRLPFFGRSPIPSQLAPPSPATVVMAAAK